MITERKEGEKKEKYSTIIGERMNERQTERKKERKKRKGIKERKVDWIPDVSVLLFVKVLEGIDDLHSRVFVRDRPRHQQQEVLEIDFPVALVV